MNFFNPHGAEERIVPAFLRLLLFILKKRGIEEKNSWLLLLHYKLWENQNKKLCSPRTQASFKSPDLLGLSQNLHSFKWSWCDRENIETVREKIYFSSSMLYQVVTYWLNVFAIKYSFFTWFSSVPDFGVVTSLTYGVELPNCYKSYG